MATRRRILAGMGIVVATAGCLGGGNSGSDGLSSAGTGATQLEEIQLQNDHDSDHEVQLAVEVDDSVVHLEVYSLREGESTQIAGDWMDATGAYQVHARLDDNAIQTIEVTGENVSCTRILIRIGTDGELSIWNGSCATAANGTPTSE